MADDLETLKEYRSNMDHPMEMLGIEMAALGWKGEGVLDHDMVMLAISKLKLLHRTLIANGMKKEVVEALMQE